MIKLNKKIVVVFLVLFFSISFFGRNVFAVEPENPEELFIVAEEDPEGTSYTGEGVVVGSEMDVPVDPADVYIDNLSECDSREEGETGFGNVFSGSIVPCGKSCNDVSTDWDETESCTLCHLLLLAQRIYNLIFSLLIIVSIVMVTVAGVMYISSSGNSGTKSKAKAIITKTITGFAVAMLSWVIVYTVLFLISSKEASSLKTSGGLTFKCDTTSKFKGTFVMISNDPNAIDPVKVFPHRAVFSAEEVAAAKAKADDSGWDYKQIDSRQWSYASEELLAYLDCMKGKLPAEAKVISSIINDSVVRGERTCQPNDYSKPPCDHERGSLHYGGWNKNCVGKSYAVDFGNENYEDEIIIATRECIPQLKADYGLKGEQAYYSHGGDHVHIQLNAVDEDGDSCQYPPKSKKHPIYK